MSGCDQCEVLSINGTACHETGCPNSWKHPVSGKGYIRDCFECGFEFQPAGVHQAVCCGCAEGE